MRATVTLGLGMALLASCSSTPPRSGAGPADAATTSSAASAPSSVATPPAPEIGAPRTGAHDGKPHGDAAAPAERRLELPSDAAFLAAPLPARAPQRYAGWRELERIEVGQSHLMDVDRLPSGRLLALSQAEGRVRIYEPGSRRLVAHHDIPQFREFERSALLAWPVAPDRFVLGTADGLFVHEAQDGISAGKRADEGGVWRLRWSADHRILMALGAGGDDQPSVLRFFTRGDGPELQRLGEIAFPERVDAWDLSPDGRLLALAHYPSGLLRVLDLRRAAYPEIYRGAAPRFAGDVAFSPDGRFLAAAGDGLLLLDLVNPERVAFYSYVKNNMGHVRFSPSADAVVASSYDGKIRIFHIGSGPAGTLSLDLAKELEHAGQANVYAFAFWDDGSRLVSASGDRTLRTFGTVTPAKGAAAGDSTNVFHDLETWARLEPGAKTSPPSRPAEMTGGQLVLDSERAPPRPSRIVPGVYACKITLIYKLRKCWVRRDADGRTRLEFAEDNLLHLGGVLWDEAGATRFEGKLLTPSTIIECPGCDRQPLHAVFRGTGGKYRGLLTFRKYYDPHVPPPAPPLDVRIEEANDRYPLVLEYRGPLEAAQLEE